MMAHLFVFTIDYYKVSLVLTFAKSVVSVCCLKVLHHSVALPQSFSSICCVDVKNWQALPIDSSHATMADLSRELDLYSDATKQHKKTTQRVLSQLLSLGLDTIWTVNIKVCWKNTSTSQNSWRKQYKQIKINSNKGVGGTNLDAHHD